MKEETKEDIVIGLCMGVFIGLLCIPLVIGALWSLEYAKITAEDRCAVEYEMRGGD